MTPEQMLAEAESVIRAMPPRPTIRHPTPENQAWFGRAVALISVWRPAHVKAAHEFVGDIFGIDAHRAGVAVNRFLVLVQQARHELLNAVDPMSIVVDQGAVFAYFDALRERIEMAKSEVLFVDPYLDADFVSYYFPHVTAGTTIRLLTGKQRLPALLSAVDLWVQQTKALVQVRSSDSLHDRWLFIDATQCYQSGASFKDGARKAPTTLTQITDAFQAMWDTYQRIWDTAKVERN